MFCGSAGTSPLSMTLEDHFDRPAKKNDIAIFCWFLMDNFNGEVHWHMLPRLGTNHSHLIPVEDYEARVLEDRLLSDYQQPLDMPRAQALLLALRQVLPTVADPVLQRSRNLYAASHTA
jgi:hypothetical protein